MDGRVFPPHVQDAWASRRTEALGQQLARAGVPPVAAIVFDAYGTLFDVRSVEAACTRLTPHGEAFAALWRTKQLEYSWLRTLMSAYGPFEQVTGEALDYALRRYDLAPDEALRRDLLDSWLALEPFPAVPGTLERLAEWPLAILSNGSPAMLEPLLRNSGLADAFRLVLSVDPVEAYKPDPRVYALAPAALGVEVSQVLFVSANPFDVIGAGHYGYQVAWCNRSGQPLDTYGPPPDLELRGLHQLPDALGR